MNHRSSNMGFRLKCRACIFFVLIFLIGTMNCCYSGSLDILKELGKGKNNDIGKAVKILEGAGNILASSGNVDYKTEFTIGESLALEGFQRYGLPIEDRKFQDYVNLVGSAVAENSSRPGIPYYFVVVKSDVYNAFSCPGGIIFVSSKLVEIMDDESELAGVLSHEVAHVAHRHALSSIRRAKFFEGVGKITAATTKKENVKLFQDMIGNLQTVLFDHGLDKDMEFEADSAGMETAYRTGYDPEGLVRVLEKLKGVASKAGKSGSWFSTHPPLGARLSKCGEKLKSLSDTEHMPRVKSRFLDMKKRL